MADFSTATPTPEGAAIVERIGWSDASEDRPSRFTATLIFSNGAPRLSVRHVLLRIPVHVVSAIEHDTLRDLLTELLAYALDAPPELKSRVAKALAAAEGQPS